MDEVYMWDPKFDRAVAKSCKTGASTGDAQIVPEEEEVLATIRECMAIDFEATKQFSDLLLLVLGRAARNTSGMQILSKCMQLTAMLVSKNIAYGDSALSPVRIFSHVSEEEQLLVRIDDKLSRVSRGSAAGEDVIQDLIGYLVLLSVKRDRDKE